MRTVDAIPDILKTVANVTEDMSVATIVARFSSVHSPASDEIKNKIKWITYHNLVRQKKLRAGIYIFTGLCVLTNLQKRIGIELADFLENAGDSFKVLNHPQKVLKRYDLLKTLHEKGINHFSCYKVDEFLKEGKVPDFPVFVREENHHSGSLSGVINDSESLKEEIHKQRKKGYAVKNLLIVEYLDVSESNGMYKKYSAFKLADAILPSQAFIRNTRTKVRKIIKRGFN